MSDSDEFRTGARLSRVDKVLYSTLVLDCHAMLTSPAEARREMMATLLVETLPSQVAKAKLKDLDPDRLGRDLRSWFTQHGWLRPGAASSDFPDVPRPGADEDPYEFYQRFLGLKPEEIEDNETVFAIACEAEGQTGIEELRAEIYDKGLVNVLSNGHYGKSAAYVLVSLICYKHVPFAPRTTFRKDTRLLGVDVKLNFDEVVAADATGKRKIVAEQLIQVMTKRIRKYRFDDFDVDRLEKDLGEWFRSQGWLNDVTR